MAVQPSKEETYTVQEIWKFFDRKISIRKIYYMIEEGAFGDGNVFRFAGSRGTCVLKAAVQAYRDRCRVEVGA